MKIGIIFKKEFHDRYGGNKDEFFGDIITIKTQSLGDNKSLKIKLENKDHTIERIERFPVEVIQLIYLGDWK